MEETRCTLQRKCKPPKEKLIDGPNQYVHLKEAIEMANEDDTVAIIPPNGSDLEEYSDDEDGDHDLVDVAGMLEIVTPAEGDVQQGTHKPKQWRKHLQPQIIKEGDRIPTLHETHPFLDKLTPAQLFRLFLTKDLVEMIAHETERYAHQNGNLKFGVTSEEIEIFIVLLLYSGYVQVPRYTMYWDTSVDTSFTFPSSLMSRNRFQQIKKYLHFADNNNINYTQNRYAKVQPLFDHLNNVLIQFGILYE
jgi:hypothetical protein